MRIPESENGSRRENEQRRDLPDNVGSHLVVGILFGLALVSNPRRTLNALRSHGIGVIPSGYRAFYKGVRPDISYP